jgi:antitoxin MazE
LQAGDSIEIVVAGARRFEVARESSRDVALERLRALKRPLPKGFKFARNVKQ